MVTIYFWFLMSSFSYWEFRIPWRKTVIEVFFLLFVFGNLLGEPVNIIPIPINRILLAMIWEAGEIIMFPQWTMMGLHVKFSVVWAVTILKLLGTNYWWILKDIRLSNCLTNRLLLRFISLFASSWNAG